MTSGNGARPAVFLDRDGVICENRDDYVKSWDEFVFVPGAARAVAELTRAGHRVFIVTNQSAIGRGVVPASEVDKIHDLMTEAIEAEGGRLEEILVCPHAPSDGCGCRKPAPGMLTDAAARHGIDLAGSWLVGDAASDCEAAAAAGCGSVLVLTGRGRAQARDAKPGYVARDLPEAARWILARLPGEVRETR
ncbi:MAG TPA: D-glycero-beta-D-manno-heptose 1,7-bisphosphate 7-phosphatase [Actinomycetota bacterium]|nr:D-glycero-beta-D-manno-heptose 1,7-bisphosphate 7-phosphatase [Actinomycetota bacterium]